MRDDDAEYLKSKYEAMFGAEDKQPREVLFSELKTGLEDVAKGYPKTDGPFQMGGTIS